MIGGKITPPAEKRLFKDGTDSPLEEVPINPEYYGIGLRSGTKE